MDAIRFRDRAAKAREMAKSGDDVRLSRMLLDVARDLDAEAEAIDSETRVRISKSELPGPFGLRERALLAATNDTAIVPIQIIAKALFMSEIDEKDLDRALMLQSGPTLPD